ncbi:MAG: mechanosensitive ion channel [Cyclobacteriaceae bacterium]
MTFTETINDLHPIVGGLIIFGAAFVVGLLIRFIFLWMVNRFASAETDRVFLKSLKKRMKGTHFLFVPFILLNVFLDYLDIDPALLEILHKILHVLIVASITIVTIRFIHVIQDVLFDNYDISDANNAKARKARTQIIFLRKIIVVVIVLIAFAVALLTFEGVRKYGATLLTSAGVAGIIIGFAAQKTIANLLAGFQIAFTQPIKIDDAVVVEGEWGWIEEINLTYVVVKIWDLRRLILPSTYFTDNPFQNWTRSSAQILGSVYLYTDYTINVDDLREKFKTILNETDLWDKHASVVQVTDSSEKTLTLRFLMTAKDSPTAWDLRCVVREKLIKHIQEKYPEALPRTRAELTKD